jgi:AraC-like DNA-binding protein
MLHDQLEGAPDFRSRVIIAERWLWKKFLLSKYTEDTVSNYVQKQLLVLPSPCFWELERKTGYSLRTLERRFLEHSGISMKHYSDIARLQNILVDLAHHNYEDMLDLVVKYDFSSVAHFSSTIQRFTGYSPTKLAADFLQNNADKIITAYLQQN